MMARTSNQSKKGTTGRGVSMKIPLDVYRQLQKLAESNYRSITGQLQLLITEASRKESMQ